MTLFLNYPGPTNAELLSFGQDPDSIPAPLNETIAPGYNPFKRPLKATLTLANGTEQNPAASAIPAGVTTRALLPPQSCRALTELVPLKREAVHAGRLPAAKHSIISHPRIAHSLSNTCSATYNFNGDLL